MTANAKRRVLNETDLDTVEWTRYGSGPDALDVAHIEREDGPWVLMRNAAPDSLVLVFTPSEWDAFRSGAADGEFSREFRGTP